MFSKCRRRTIHAKLAYKLRKLKAPLISFAVFPDGYKAISYFFFANNEHVRYLLGLGVPDLPADLFIPVIK